MSDKNENSDPRPDGSPRSKSGLTVGIVVAIFVMVVIFGVASRGCSTSLGTEGPVVVHDNDEYVEASKEAKDLSEPVFKKVDGSEQINEFDRDDLKKALRLYEGMLGYLPTNPLPQFPMGQIFDTLGDHKKAIQSFQAYLDATTRGTSAEALVTRADTHFMLSNAYLKSQDYTNALSEANAALKAFPGTANYLIARASAYTQLNKKKEALDDLSEALSKEPQNRRAMSLYSFLNK